MDRTNRTNRMTLDFPHRRAYLFAFWLVMLAGVAATSALAAWLLGVPLPWLWPVVVPALVIVPGTFWPTMFDLGLGGWNRGIGLLFGILRRWALFVGYYAMFPLLRIVDDADAFKGRMPDAERGTAWVPVEPATATLTAYTLRTERCERRGTSSAWLHDLARQARATNSRWLIALAPLVLTLRLLEGTRGEQSPPTSTYTLY
jgi:hypothetical protein